MKKLLYLLLFVLVLVSCKNETKQEPSKTTEAVPSPTIAANNYPEAVTKVFNVHGGLANWKQMHSLVFTIAKPTGKEKVTKDLKTRAELIEAPTYTQGFDGETLWVMEKEGPYKGNPKFYNGLMFYFYAMPFVFADEGILYAETEPLVFEGKTYPGVLISFKAGVGQSSNDKYKMFYDTETGKMAWLAYTVTFGKAEGRSDFHFIRYNNWQTVNGLVLPKSIDWYTYENNEPIEKRNTVEFTDVFLSEKAPNPTLFSMPEGAKRVE